MANNNIGAAINTGGILGAKQAGPTGKAGGPGAIADITAELSGLHQMSFSPSGNALTAIGEASKI